MLVLALMDEKLARDFTSHITLGTRRVGCGRTSYALLQAIENVAIAAGAAPSTVTLDSEDR